MFRKFIDLLYTRVFYKVRSQSLIATKKSTLDLMRLILNKLRWLYVDLDWMGLDTDTILVSTVAEMIFWLYMLLYLRGYNADVIMNDYLTFLEGKNKQGTNNLRLSMYIDPENVPIDVADWENPPLHQYTHEYIVRNDIFKTIQSIYAYSEKRDKFFIEASMKDKDEVARGYFTGVDRDGDVTLLLKDRSKIVKIRPQTIRLITEGD